jgi:hypothetical protein
MTRILTSIYFWIMFAVYAYAQNAPEPAPTPFTEPASATAVVVFLVLFLGSIGLFGFWIWYRSKKQKTH